ncbi:MAG: 2Fe-2S iron-sulfur cluster-binding protein, partial [Candidatus Competibacteraceae bacterium]|nr:2Fe-2S iron-sulfur cluster-binding protein [Candidatus Competibacteraceae bacterium]
MPESARHPAEPEPIQFTLNGTAICANPNETILQAAQRNGIEIPHLCYQEGLRPDGNCRACVVEIEGERVLAPSCCRYPQADMKVSSSSDRAVHSQNMVLELLLSDMPDEIYKRDSELHYWTQQRGLKQARFPARQQPKTDDSHPAMAVNLDACIQCTRCVRACREEQVND